MKTLIFDLETNGLLDTMDKIWSCGIGDPETGEITVYTDYSDKYEDLSVGVARLAAADRVVAHNLIGFDYHALKMFYPEALTFEKMYDSIVVAALLEPDRRSHAIKSYGEEFGAPKGDYTDFENFCQEMIDYMVRDVEINLRIYNKQQKQITTDKTDWTAAIDLEHKVQWCLSLQEQNGFRLDIEAANKLEGILREEKVMIERSLQDIFPPMYVPAKGNWDWSENRWCNVDVSIPKVNRRPQGITKGTAYTKIAEEMFNPSSRQQVIRRLSMKYPRWKPTIFTPSGIPQIDETVLSTMPIPEAKPLMRYFRLVKQLGQLADGKNAWLKVEKKGRVHGRVKSIGARTHRMSHFYPNMAQVDKKDTRMREVWVADEGHKLVGCDASGLELRMLAHYLGIWDNGAYGEGVVKGTQSEGTDVHTRTQKIAGLHSRNSAKTLTYAFLYGAGNEKLSQVMCDDAEDANQPQPKGKGYKLGKSTRDKLMQGIKGLDKLTGICQQRDATQGYLKGLDGRNVETKGQHSALNTLLQSAGAIVMKKALVIFHFEECKRLGLVDDNLNPIGWGYVANVHDEIQISAEPAIAEAVGQAMSDSIRMAGEQLSLRCPLDGEYMIGDNWSDTH